MARAGIPPYDGSMSNTDPGAVRQLVALSNEYGSPLDYVIAGGGNTSWKNRETLWVKSSGQSLGTIREEGFARMDRSKLAALWTRTFETDPDQREKQVLEALMGARLPGEETKRPSVETLLHDMMPFEYVVHTHPTLVNALTCGRKGRQAFDRLFAEIAVWIPWTDPGYLLSKAVKEALAEFCSRRGRFPAVIFLQNHGVVVADDTPSGIRATYDQILGTLKAEVPALADLTPQGTDPSAEVRFLRALEPLAPFCVRTTAAEVLALAVSDQTFVPVSSAFTPDHIVYMGVAPVRVTAPEEIPAAFASYQSQYGKPPRVVLVPGLGAFCLGTSPKVAGQAQLLFHDAVKIALASRAFGGPLFMTEAAIDFIVHWEVEAFRSQVSGK